MGRFRTSIKWGIISIFNEAGIKSYQPLESAVLKKLYWLGKGVDAYATGFIVIRFHYGSKLCTRIYGNFFRAEKCKFNVGLVNGLIFHSNSWISTLFNLREKAFKPAYIYMGYKKSSWC